MLNKLSGVVIGRWPSTTPNKPYLFTAGCLEPAVSMNPLEGPNVTLVNKP